MAKKILFIYYQNVKPGGVARVMINLANELCETDCEVIILFLMEGKNTFYEINPKIKIYTLDSFGHWGLKTFNPILDKYFNKFRYKFNLKKYIYDFGQWQVMNNWLKDNHQKFDVIISCWYKLSSQIALNKKIAAKTLAWEHSNFEVGGKIWGNLLRPKYKNLLGIVCINSSSLEYYETYNKNVFLIPNIIGEPFENITEINFQEKKNQLIYVGRLDEEKNVANLIDVISRVDMKDFIFKIIGDGAELEKLKKIVNRKNLESKIFFMGRQNIEEIKNNLLQSKIFLFMSKTEAFGMVLLEALFCGNALISYDCNYGPSDIVKNDNGFLVPMNDDTLFQKNLQNLINNAELLKNLNQSAFLNSLEWKKNKTLVKWNEAINLSTNKNKT